MSQLTLFQRGEPEQFDEPEVVARNDHLSPIEGVRGVNVVRVRVLLPHPVHLWA